MDTVLKGLAYAAGAAVLTVGLTMAVRFGAKALPAGAVKNVLSLV